MNNSQLQYKRSIGASLSSCLKLATNMYPFLSRVNYADCNFYLCPIVGLLLLLFIVPGCDRRPLPESSADGVEQLEQVTLMLNWHPEAEHGGYYAAQVHGIFERYGLEVEIRPGGPNAPVAQELVTGRAHFALGNADDVLLFRNQDVPVVALLAPFQNTPRCILVRAEAEARDLSDLSGMILQANTGRPFLDYMRAEGHLEGVQVVPYSGSVAKLVSDPNTAIQAYSFSEPFMAREQGVEVRTLMLSDIGFNPYASCLLATESYIADEPQVVHRMVLACREGWQQYLQDPQQANRAILEDNEFGLTADALAFGMQAVVPLCLPDQMPLEQVGQMQLERWQTLIQQFEDLELIAPGKLTASKVFSNQYQEQVVEQPLP